jgi:hypothetical protein
MVILSNYKSYLIIHFIQQTPSRLVFIIPGFLSVRNAIFHLCLETTVLEMTWIFGVLSTCRAFLATSDNKKQEAGDDGDRPDVYLRVYASAYVNERTVPSN